MWEVLNNFVLLWSFEICSGNVLRAMWPKWYLSLMVSSILQSSIPIINLVMNITCEWSCAQFKIKMKNQAFCFLFFESGDNTYTIFPLRFEDGFQNIFFKMDFLKVMIGMKLHYQRVVESINQISSNKKKLERELMRSLGMTYYYF